MLTIIFEGIEFNEPDFINTQKNRNKTLGLIKRGELKRNVCEICGKKADAHHEKYNDYFNVRWLCRKHHNEVHRIFRQLNPDSFDKQNYFKGIIDRVLLKC